jgi:hypothetical protein
LRNDSRAASALSPWTTTSDASVTDFIDLVQFGIAETHGVGKAEVAVSKSPKNKATVYPIMAGPSGRRGRPFLRAGQTLRTQRRHASQLNFLINGLNRPDFQLT